MSRSSAHIRSEEGVPAQHLRGREREHRPGGHGPPAPFRGRTVTGGVFATQPGGKGANQALAAGAAGARVTLVAAIGADLFAERALEILRASDVDLSGLVTLDDAPTGVALIVVDETGENLIAVASGANDRLEPRHVAARGSTRCCVSSRSQTTPWPRPPVRPPGCSA